MDELKTSFNGVKYFLKIDFMEYMEEDSNWWDLMFRETIIIISHLIIGLDIVFDVYLHIKSITIWKINL